MACRLIIGRRDSDRTASLYEAIFRGLDKGKKVYLILPEQATFLHERQIEQMRGERSLWNLEITSFRRLAERHILEPSLDGLGRSLLIYDILAENKDRFAALKPKDISVGFINDIDAVLKEISMNGLDAGFLRDKAAELAEENGGADLADKLNDLALIRELFEEQGMEDENGRLFGFASWIRGEQKFADSLFCFDDFFDFTAAEYAVIEALFDIGIDAVFSFLCDRGETVFAKTEDAVSRLIRMASAVNVPLDIENLPSLRKDDALSYLEKNYFLPGRKRYENNCDDLTLIAADDQCGEICAFARIIADLALDGASFSDIGICFRDIGAYQRHIEEYFDLYDIPYHIDSAVSLITHPVYHYASSLLRLVNEEWSYPSFFALLKTGLFPVDEDDCDLLENYCLCHAIKGNRFYQKKPWPYQDEWEHEDREYIDTVRRRIVDLLLPVTKKIGKKDSVYQYAKILWHFLEVSRCAETIESWCAGEEERGDLKKSAELSAGMTAFADLLDQIVAAFPDREFTLAEFSELLKMGAAAVTVRTIPAELDSVEISVLGLSRPTRKKYLFIGGANEDVFPASLDHGGLLNNTDRDMLKRHAENWVQDKTFYFESEQLLVYQALTTALEKIWVSYALWRDAEKCYPSTLVLNLKRMFPKMREIKFHHDSLSGLFSSPEELLAELPKALRDNDDEEWVQIRDFLLADPAYAERTKFLLRSLDYNGESQRLLPDLLKSYPKSKLALSVSSIGLFRQCPFAYFSRYGLKLNERKILRFEHADLGNVLHDTLREIMETLKNHGEDLYTVYPRDPERINGFIEELVAEKIAVFAQDNLFPEEYLAYISRLHAENVRLVVEMIVRQAEAGDKFLPRYWEIPFGDGQDLPAYVIPIDDADREIRLRGVIDRVDFAEKDGERYLRIVDYKSSDKKLRLEDIYYGTMPQLPVYMMVMENQSSAYPSGIFYQTMKDAFVNDGKTLPEEKIKEGLDNEMALKGYIIDTGDSEQCYAPRTKADILSEKEYRLMRRHTERSIYRCGKEIFAGKTEIRPYVKSYDGSAGSCDFCPYGPVCGYEPGIMGKEDRLKKMSPAEAITKMEAEDAGK